MIRVESLRIVKFRGIVDMTLDLGGRNHAVSGPNGTGKSGVVDALEFALTGDVSRLAGVGRGNLSVSAHGPHVDHRASPEEAFVEVGVRVGQSEPVVLVRRSVARSQNYSLDPEDVGVRKLIDGMKGRKEVALSRREIIRFVIAEPGKRAADVQALLKLDELEEIRKRLQRIAKSEEKGRKDAASAVERSKADLRRAMAIEVVDEQDVLAAANARRALLLLTPLVPAPDVALDEGLAEVSGSVEPPLDRARSLRDLDAVEATVRSRSAAEFQASCAEARLRLERLRSSETLLAKVTRDTFYEMALEIFDGDACPACDTPWDQETFVGLISAKQAELKQAKELRGNAANGLRTVAAVLKAERNQLRCIFPTAKRLLPEAEAQVIADHGKAVGDLVERLDAPLPVDAALAALGDVDALSGLEIVKSFRTAVEAIPEGTADAAARSYLVTAQERFLNLKKTEGDLRERASRAELAKKVHSEFKTTVDETLEGIYRQVQDDFAALYKLINAGDEEAFEAEMTPSLGKLGFDVDFYGRDRFPPGAFHSEGHQDGMGLCLYLALMRHILGEDFTFAVLDDVMMSIDAEHRRGVLDLLRSEFPHTQFVVTTHDKVWSKHLTSHGFIKRGDTTDFLKWTVEEGPTTRGGSDWDGVRAYLENGDVPAAARALRGSLEYLAAEYCDALRAPVPFRSNGNYGIGDLFDPAVKKMKSLLKEARTAAATWDRAEPVEARETAFLSAAAQCNEEQWQLNPVIHYNEWANLSRAELERVVHAYENLCRLFGCDECGSLLKVMPKDGTRASLQCACNATTLSFARRKSGAGPRRNVS